MIAPPPRTPGAPPAPAPKPTYRMYVDEVGHADMGPSTVDPNQRYLSLTGIIIRYDLVRAQLSPELEGLKTKHFDSHPDEPLVFHRKELMNAKYPFGALRDQRLRAAFDADLLALIQRLDFLVITVVIDKHQHKQQYTRWTFHPYHYCMHALLERYVMCLESKWARGDVVAESRGGKEDRTLAASFKKAATSGTEQVSAQSFHRTMVRTDLILKNKEKNVAGLQLADLIAHPSFKDFKAVHEKTAQPGGMAGKIVAVLNESKYRRSPSGVVLGFGRKWLP